MTTLIDLSPTNRGGSVAKPHTELARAFEIALEFIESLGSLPFTRTQLFRACGYMPATDQAIRLLMALGFVERLSPVGARPVYFRVADHALPVLP